MSAPKDKELKEYLDDPGKQGILKKIIMTPAVILKYRQIYNLLCNKCRYKAVQDPRIGLENYCGICRPRIEGKLEEIKKMLS
jgi:hypothetical protein